MHLASCIAKNDLVLALVQISVLIRSYSLLLLVATSDAVILFVDADCILDGVRLAVP